MRTQGPGLRRLNSKPGMGKVQVRWGKNGGPLTALLISLTLYLHYLLLFIIILLDHGV